MRFAGFAFGVDSFFSLGCTPSGSPSVTRDPFKHGRLHGCQTVNSPSKVGKVAFNYDWIVPGLAQGNFPGDVKTAFRDFDVILLCAEEHQPRWSAPSGKFIFKLPLDDDPYQPVPMDVGRVVVQTAKAAGTYHAAGHPLITTCHQGRNRSGICTAIILMHFYKMGPQEAIDLVRRKRNDDCIGNPMFEQFLHNYHAYE